MICNVCQNEIRIPEQPVVHSTPLRVRDPFPDMPGYVILHADCSERLREAEQARYVCTKRSSTGYPLEFEVQA